MINVSNLTFRTYRAAEIRRGGGWLKCAQEDFSHPHSILIDWFYDLDMGREKNGLAFFFLGHKYYRKLNYFKFEI